MADSDSRSFHMPHRRVSVSFRTRPATSYDLTPDTTQPFDLPPPPVMSYHLAVTKNAAYERLAKERVEQSDEPIYPEPMYHDPFSESTMASTPLPSGSHTRRRSSLAQSVKSGIFAFSRRMSATVKGGKSKQREVSGEIFKLPNTPLHQTEDVAEQREEEAQKSQTSRLFKNLKIRRRPSMPLLNLGNGSQDRPTQRDHNYQNEDDVDESQQNTNKLTPISKYVTGGAGARASAAAQNEALLAAQTPLLAPQRIEDVFGSGVDNRDSESGIGISLDYAETNITIPTHLTRCDPCTTLPTEVMEEVLSHLDGRSLMTAQLVSRKWSEMGHSQIVWREVFHRAYAKNRPARISERSSAPGLGKIIPGQDYYRLYKIRQLIDQRWENGVAAAVYLNGHKDSVYCVQFDENKIVTGSRDNTIRIWDARTYQCIRKLGPPHNPRERVHVSHVAVEPSGIVPFVSHEATSPDPIPQVLSMWHQASVLCLQYDDEILVTGSSDHSCIVWSVKDDYRPLFRLEGHAAGVLDVCIDTTTIVTCSKDTTIKIWNRFTGRLLKTFIGHRGPVNAVQVRGNLLASASGDGMSKLWRLEDGMCIKEFRSKERGLACVEFSEDGRTIFAGGNDHVIYEFNTITGNVERELPGHTALVRSLHLDSNNGRIVSGSYDHSIKVWDSRRGNDGAEGGLKINLEGWTSSWMLAAKSNYRKIACASQDGRVVIVDFGYGIDGVEQVEA